jgi:L-ascorbate metabolism protein UlaG (beta-lactamase superfamily)
VTTLTYLGHAAFLVEHDRTTIAVDPFLTGNPLAARQAADIAPSVILLTHAHNDHVGDTVEIAKRTGATVISTFELGEWLTGQGVTGAIPANHGGTVAFDGGTVKLVPAWHTSSYTHDGQVVAPGVPAGLVVRIGGKTIYFAGDTCLFGDMRLIGDEGLDLAVLPIGDHFTMGPGDAVRAAEFLNVPAVVPCHFNTFPSITQDPHAFGRLLKEKTGARAIILDPGSSHAL